MVTATPNRSFRYWVLGALVFLAALAALALFARSETALRWAASQAAAWSDGRIVLREVSGSILGPLRAGQALYRDESTEVAIEALELHWNPLGLLRGQVRVTRLAAARATVINKPTPEPTRLPENLSLPYPVTVLSLDLPRLVFRGDGYETVLENIAGRIDARPGQYRFRLDSLSYEGSALNGDATLDSATPFAANGSLKLATDLNGRKIALPLALSGTLESLRVQGMLDESWGKGAIDVLVAPFADEELRELAAALREINPAGLQDGAPEADLALNFSARNQEGRLLGAVRVENRQPGTLDRNLLPLEALQSPLEISGDGVRLDALQISLGRGGSFSGEGMIAADGVRLRLETRGVDLNALHRSLKPLRPAGTITVTATGNQQDIAARLETGIYRLALEGRIKDQSLGIREATLRARGSELALNGEFRLDGARPFSATGVLRDFDPALWGDFPKARINARLGAEGTLSPAPEGTLRYEFGRSRFRNEPIEGTGTLHYSRQGTVGGEGHVALGGNRLDYKGSLGAANARLDWSLQAPRLAALGTDYAGSLGGSGWISGDFQNPSLSFSLSGQELRAPGVALAAIEAGGDLGLDHRDPLRLKLEARGLKSGQLALDAVEADVAGTRERHTLTLAASGPQLEFTAAAEGGLGDKFRWSGTLQRLESRKPQPLQLLAPARLALAADRVDIGATEIAWGPGKLVLDFLGWQPGMLRTSGRASSLPLTQALPRTDSANWQSSLVLGGDWDLDIREQLEGRARLWREGGDISLGSPKPVALGLAQLTVQLDGRGSMIEATATAEGSGLGSLRGRIETRMERVEGRWRLPRTAPLSGELRASMPSIAWLGPLVDPTLGLAGAIEITASASGTVASPQLQGSVSGNGLEAHVDAAGLHLDQGTLAADFTDDRLLLRNLTLRGGDGSVSASGVMSFAEGSRRGELDFKLNRLALVKMPAQLLEVSGNGRMLLEGNTATLTGSIRADRGLIEVREWDRPRLSEDVVIVGREKAPPEERSSRLRLDLDLDLGDDFRVKGAGLDARLQGNVQVRSDDGVMKAKGVVRVAEGHYTAYGQQLKIERGALLFDGPLSNPVLDILAIRKNQAVEAGVAISGTALSPRTKLVSNPPVPDQEKLSWLVLGQGTGARDESVFSLPGANVQPDDFVSIGTQLTTSLYVGVGRSLAGTGTILKLTYVISDRWAVQTRSGDATGATVIYTISFD